MAWTKIARTYQAFWKETEGFLHVAFRLSEGENRTWGTQRMLGAGVCAESNPGKLSYAHQEALSQ